MNDSVLRLATGGLVGIGALCIIGMVVTVAFGHDSSAALAIAVSLSGAAGTCIGGLVGILVPTGRPPNQLSNVYQPGPNTVSFQPPPANVPSQNTGP